MLTGIYCTTDPILSECKAFQLGTTAETRKSACELDDASADTRVC